MSSIASTPVLDTHLETQAGLYPTLRYLVRLLPLGHRCVRNQLQEEAKHNPFLLHRSATNHSETLLEDVLPEWYTPAASEPNLQAHLAGQIAVLSLPLKQRDALTYLTHWLSPSSYLEDAAKTWANGSQWSAKELMAVVAHLQRLDPPGIGARSLQECLLLQLRRSATQFSNRSRTKASGSHRNLHWSIGTSKIESCSTFANTPANSFTHQSQ